MHPSEGLDDDFNPEKFLPEGVTLEQGEALIRDVVDEFSKLGLYCRSAHLAATMEAIPTDEDDSHVILHGVFTIGKVAFTPRIQDPEQEAFDETFRMFEKDDLKATIEDIVGEFKRGKETP